MRQYLYIMESGSDLRVCFAYIDKTCLPIFPIIAYTKSEKIARKTSSIF